MIVLGIDTSTEYLTVSIISENKKLADYNAIGRLNHSALLVPTIQKALRKARKKLKDVCLFAVGIGPGSWTGLRIGVTAMRAFSIALDKPIIGVPTMDAIAHNCLTYIEKDKLFRKSGSICPIIDAKKSQVYACIYEAPGGKLVKRSGYLLEPVEHLFKRLKGRVIFLGDGVNIYKQKLTAEKSIKAELLDNKKWFPKASVIARLGLQMFESGKSDNPYSLEPLYIYARDCNVRK